MLLTHYYVKYNNSLTCPDTVGNSPPRPDHISKSFLSKTPSLHPDLYTSAPSHLVLKTARVFCRTHRCLASRSSCLDPLLPIHLSHFISRILLPWSHLSFPAPPRQGESLMLRVLREPSVFAYTPLRPRRWKLPFFLHKPAVARPLRPSSSIPTPRPPRPPEAARSRNRSPRKAPRHSSIPPPVKAPASAGPPGTLSTLPAAGPPEPVGD